MPLGGIGEALGGIGVLAGLAGRGGKRFDKDALRVFKELELSNFDMSKLSPPELQLVAQYLPQSYEFAAPQSAEVPLDSPELRASQMRGLGGLEQIAQEGLPLQDRLLADEASREVFRASTGQNQAIMRNLAERGRLSGGTEVAARMAGSQQASELARGYGSDIARQAIQNRLGALQSVPGVAGAIRGQDFSNRSQAADVINRFNEFVSGGRTSAAADAAGSRERAQVSNTRERQRIGDTNVLSRYQTESRNQEYLNDQRERQFQQALAKARGTANAYGNLSQGAYGEQAAKAAQIQGIGRGVGGAAGFGLGLGGVGGF
jgi:hypothetical protein